MLDLRRVRLPMDTDTARSLTLGEMVFLEGEVVVTAGLPTHHRLIECARQQRPLPRDLSGAALFHLGSQSAEDEGGKLNVLYMNPTTSTRFNALMPELIRSFGLTAVGGKGGLDRGCADAMKEVGCVYFSFIGGGCPLISDSIQEVISVDWSDLISHYRLVTLRVKDLGPATVAIDAHGNSLYANLTETAEAKKPAILAQLAADRARD